MEELVFAEVVEPTAELAVTYRPAVIADNLTALDAWVDAQIEPYVGAVIDVTSKERISEARKAMADLNKMAEPIEAERKRIKKAYSQPLEEFEGRVKGTVAKIRAARDGIKAQVDEAMEEFRRNRLSVLEEEYAAVAGPVSDVIPLSAILDQKWLRSSETEQWAVGKLQQKAAEALRGYNALMGKELAHRDECVKHYAETLDLVGALELEDRLNERDREMAAFKAAQAEMAAAREDRIPEQPKERPQQSAQGLPTAQEPAVKRWELVFDASRDDAYAVRDFMRQLPGLKGVSFKEVRHG